MQQLFFFNEITVAGGGLSNITQENVNYILFLASTGISNLDDALWQYFSPFESGENVYQKWFQTLPIILLINLHRLGDQQGHTFKDCHSIRFDQFIDLAQFTNPRCDQARYKLTGLISHQGHNPAEGHYISFHYVNESWYLFDDSNVWKVDESAVFDENYPKHASSQTAILLVYQLSL
jgi:hypothetical protein